MKILIHTVSASCRHDVVTPVAIRVRSSFAISVAVVSYPAGTDFGEGAITVNGVSVAPFRVFAVLIMHHLVVIANSVVLHHDAITGQKDVDHGGAHICAMQYSRLQRYHHPIPDQDRGRRSTRGRQLLRDQCYAARTSATDPASFLLRRCSNGGAKSRNGTIGLDCANQSVQVHRQMTRGYPAAGR